MDFDDGLSIMLRFHITVNSRYCGHSRDRNLVSVLARVRNSRLREMNFTERGLLVITIILTAVRQTRAVFTRTKSIVIISTNRTVFNATELTDASGRRIYPINPYGFLQ